MQLEDKHNCDKDFQDIYFKRFVTGDHQMIAIRERVYALFIESVRDFIKNDKLPSNWEPKLFLEMARVYIESKSCSDMNPEERETHLKSIDYWKKKSAKKQFKN